MAARFPKILFTTTAPIFALFRFLSLHWSSRKHEAADAGVRDRRFDRFSFMGLPDLSLEQIGLGVSQDLSVELHMSAMRVSRQCESADLTASIRIRWCDVPHVPVRRVELRAATRALTASCWKKVLEEVEGCLRNLLW